MPWAKKPDEGYFSKRGFWKNKWTQMKTGMGIGWKKKRERRQETAQKKLLKDSDLTDCFSKKEERGSRNFKQRQALWM